MLPQHFQYPANIEHGPAPGRTRLQWVGPAAGQNTSQQAVEPQGSGTSPAVDWVEAGC